MSNFVSQISKCDADFVKSFVDFVNGKMSSKNDTGKELAKVHRYLQQEMFEVFFCFMKELAYTYKNGRYDARNEMAARFSAEAYQRLIECDFVFDPNFPNH